MPVEHTCDMVNQSNDFYDFIVEEDFKPELYGIPSDACIEEFGVKYQFLHLPQTKSLDAYIDQLGYTAIPKVFGLMDTTSIESTGALRLQNQPLLTLRGQGIIIGIIDTGIAYDLSIFRNEDGTSRIASLWDQTLPALENDGPGSGSVPACKVSYGRSFSNEQINLALQSDNPYEEIPSIDEEEHGTFLAGIAAGRYDRQADFIGTAPDSSLAIVKLKQVKPYLRDFYGIEDGVPAYSEIDIMNGVRYLLRVARLYMKPIVILIGAGTNQGGHDGRMPLSDYLSTIADLQGIAVVQAAGNEGNARRHYVGRVSEQNWDTVELRVGKGVKGFNIELWGNSLNTFYVGLRSPSGRVIPPIPPQGIGGHQYRFPAEGSIVTIYDRVPKMQGGDFLVLIRFETPSEGIWELQVATRGDFATDYHLWMPIRQFVSEDTYFLSSNPYTTLTSNACAVNSIAVGMYQHLTDSLTPEGSKGFTRTNLVKPDILAPGVNVYGPLPSGAYGTMTGSSVAAAHAAGAVALIFEYGIVKGNFSYIDGADARAILIRSASRKENLEYPNRDWGYGTLNVFQAFQEFVGQI